MIVEALLVVPTPCAGKVIGVLGERVAAAGVVPVQSYGLRRAGHTAAVVGEG